MSFIKVEIEMMTSVELFHHGLLASRISSYIELLPKKGLLVCKGI